MSGTNAGGVDTKRFSRQLYVMGVEAQARMAASDVLVVGLDGGGAEAGEPGASMQAPLASQCGNSCAFAFCVPGAAPRALHELSAH